MVTTLHPSKTKKNHKQIEVNKPFLLNPKHYRWIILLAAALVYLNTLPNGLSFDDNYVITPTTLKGISAIPEILTTKYIEADFAEFGYRPVVLISFAIQHSIFGQNVFWGHLINLLLYLGGLYLWWMFLSRLEINRHLVFISLLLFALHPVHTEVVASLKNRDILINQIFALSSGLFFLKFLEQRKWLFLIFSILGVAVVFITKTTGLIYFVILGLFLFNKAMHYKKEMALLLGSSAIVMLLIRIAKKSYFPKNENIAYFITHPLDHVYTSVIERIPVGILCIINYLKLLIWPTNLKLYYGYNTIPLISWNHVISIPIAVIFFSSILIIIFCWFRSKSKLKWKMAFGLWLGLFVYSNIIRTGPGIIAERFIFEISIFYCFLLGGLIFWAVKKVHHFKWLALSILIFYSALTVLRNNDWSSLEGLLIADMPKLENSAKVNMLMADYYAQKRQLRNSTQWDKIIEKHYLKAIDIYPDYLFPINNLGMLYRAQKKFDKAIPYLETSHRKEPDNHLIFYNLGEVYDLKGEKEKAKLHFVKALDRDQSDPYNQLSVRTYFKLLSESKSLQEMKNIYRKVDYTKYEDFVFVNKLGELYLAYEGPEAARSVWEFVLEKDQHNQIAKNYLLKIK